MCTKPVVLKNIRIQELDKDKPNNLSNRPLHAGYGHTTCHSAGLLCGKSGKLDFISNLA